MKQNLTPIIILLLLLFFCITNTNAQIQKNKIDFEKNEKITTRHPKAKEGTYQFIYHPSKKQYVFTTETLVEIEKRRDKKEVKYIWLNPFVEVKILPIEYIESPGFTPIPEIKYIDQ